MRVIYVRTDYSTESENRNRGRFDKTKKHRGRGARGSHLSLFAYTAHLKCYMFICDYMYMYW